MKHNLKRSLLGTTALAIALTFGGAVTAQNAKASYEEDLPTPIGNTTCVEKQASCRMMAHFPDGSTRPVYGTKTCFTGSLGYVHCAAHARSISTSSE